MTIELNLPPRAAWATPLLAALALAATQARAAEVWLRAGTTTWTPPGGAAPVTMWGYAQCGASFAGCGTITSPGPVLVVPSGDPSLTVHLQNGLGEPTSLVIPGQAATMTPVWFEPGTSTTYLGARPGGNVTARVRSFTHETPPGGTADYLWPALRPGTYLYQSGTHPQVQVQMGLYGAVTRNAADAAGALRAQAYAGVEYDRSVTVLYSEIDPVLHAAVADGTYGTTGPTSTFDYRPRWFLVNGAPYQAGAGPLDTLDGGQRVLLRFLNAGLRTHVPMLLGQHLELVAEDGNPYPWPAHPRQQYTVPLPAAKTIDAVLTTDNPGTATLQLPLLDRRLDVTNAGAPDGGLIAFLAVNPGTVAYPPVITSTPPTSALVGSPYTYQVAASDPNAADVLAYSLDAAPAGMTISPSAGLVSWTPAAAGTASVTVRVTDPGGLFATQSFSVAVTAPVNRAPVAAADGPYTMVELGTLSVAAPGVLANDTDPDGDALAAVSYSPAAGLSGNASGAFTWTLPAGAGTRTFTYQARDASLTSAPATVTVSVIANRAPVTAADSGNATRRTRTNSAGYVPVSLAVLSNDADPDAALDPANTIAPGTVVISTPPNQGGTVTVNATTGVVSYVPALNFRGTDSFGYRVRDTRGALSAAATVRVNVR